MSRSETSTKGSEILKAVSYFEGMDAAALNLVERSAIRRSYEAGQVILIEGEPCPGLYVVESGWLKAVKIGLDGREQVLHMLGPGEVFNAVSVFTDAPNQASVAALEQGALWLVRREVLLRLIDEHPPLARHVIRDLAARLTRMIGLVEDLSLRTVEGRLARLLLEQAEGGSVRRRSWATQAEMASRLGTVPDVVNRALRKLTASGAISVERHQIQIRDREALKAVAQLAE